MKYLFLLLLLTACGQKAEKQKAEAIKAKAMASADAVVEEMNDRDTSSAIIAQYELDPYFDTDRAADEGIIPLENERIAIYTNSINPYQKQYIQFFEEQVQIYGRAGETASIVNMNKLANLNIRYNFFVLFFEDEPYYQIKIISNGITNIHILRK